MGDTGGFHCSGQCNCGGLRVVFEYAGGECEGVSDLGKFSMFVLEVLGMRIMMSERSDGVRPDTVHRNSAEQCSRTGSFFFCLLLTKLYIHCLSYLGPSLYFPLAI